MYFILVFEALPFLLFRYLFGFFFFLVRNCFRFVSFLAESRTTLPSCSSCVIFTASTAAKMGEESKVIEATSAGEEPVPASAAATDGDDAEMALMPAPVVEEKEEVMDEAKLAEVRDAMKTDIRDDLDAPEDAGDSSSDDESSDDNGDDNDQSEDSQDLKSRKARKKDKASSKSKSHQQEQHLLSKHHINILSDLLDRSKSIPMRLSPKERILLDNVEGALDISEYTDKVDVSSNNYFARNAWDKEETIVSEQEDLCKQLAGLAISNDFQSMGAKMLRDRKLEDNEDYFQRAMEVGRRYKIMNPDKMRCTYGKLLYVIMDNVNPRLRLSIDLKIPVRTVYTLLAEVDKLEMLNDPLLAVAASEVDAGGSQEAASEARAQKQRALDTIVAKYASHDGLAEEDVRLVVASISDNFSFLRSNRGPVDRMIAYLKRYFNPHVTPANSEESLTIRSGRNGSKLSHQHETQYYFVLQSLTLWREIMGNFFKLWRLAEEDLLDSRNGYRLCNTGQGLQRCQSAPRVSQEMSRILATVREKVGRWIGLSVVHLGDRDVPNALIFIDKYTQVPRILGPLANTIDRIEELNADPHISSYIDKNFGDYERLRKLILADFFRHGFDGSGDDGGSCIDGRLTSCWNWCSKLEKKSYYPVFMLAGFQSFDGEGFESGM